jgi:fatty acid desaturase
VIEGREPGAPRGQAADLGAIRRSDAIIEMLASRRRLRSRVLRDPAVAVLSSLVHDVEAGARPAGARPRHTAAAAAAAAIAVAAAVVAAAGFVVVAMLTRLTGARGWERSRR